MCASFKTCKRGGRNEAPDDIDWLDIAAGAVGQEEVLAVAPAPIEVVAVAPAPIEVLAVAPAPARRKRKWDLPHPAKRTREQHALAASRMREAKVAKAKQRAEERCENMCAQLSDIVDEHGLQKKNQVLKIGRKRGKVVGLVIKRRKGMPRSSL